MRIAPLYSYGRTATLPHTLTRVNAGYALWTNNPTGSRPVLRPHSTGLASVVAAGRNVAGTSLHIAGTRWQGMPRDATHG